MRKTLLNNPPQRTAGPPAAEKGQGTLEMALTFIVIALLLGGIIKIWLWSNAQIVQRQKAYNATRVAAGKAQDNYQMQWPVYTPQELKEEEVLLEGK